MNARAGFTQQDSKVPETSGEFCCFTGMELPENHVPLFPLGILPFPGEVVALRIFEPRYKQLLKDVEEHNLLFGIPYFSGEKEGEERIFGSLVQLEKVSRRYDSGESDVLIRSVSLFEVSHFESKTGDRLYPGGSIRILDDFIEWPVSEPVREAFLQLSAQLERPVEKLSGDTFSILSELKLSVPEKLRLIRIDSKPLREKKLLALLRFSAFMLQQEKKKENDYFLN